MSLGTKPQVKGVPEKFYTQLAASHLSPPVTDVIVGDRQRKLDETTVREIYESIENTGLHSPIGIREVRVNGRRERHLIYGLHRLMAWKRKYFEAVSAGDHDRMARWHPIPALVYPEQMSDDMALLLEVQENLDRKELTTAERASGMAKRSELLARMNGESATKKGKADKPTLSASKWAPPSQAEYAGDKRGSADFKLLERQYAEYKKANHGKAWNKQTKAEFEAFRAWQKDAEDRAKAAESAAANTAQQEVYSKAIDDIKKRIAQAIADYGEKAKIELREYLAQ